MKNLHFNDSHVQKENGGVYYRANRRRTKRLTSNVLFRTATHTPDTQSSTATDPFEEGFARDTVVRSKRSSHLILYALLVNAGEVLAAYFPLPGATVILFTNVIAHMVVFFFAIHALETFTVFAFEGSIVAKLPNLGLFGGFSGCERRKKQCSQNENEHERSKHGGWSGEWRQSGRRSSVGHVAPCLKRSALSFYTATHWG